MSESDHEVYDKAILKTLRPTDKNILIIGGGDGFVAESILKKNPRAKITIAELDADIVYCAKTYFEKSDIFEHPNVTLCIGDAIKYLTGQQGTRQKFDGIIIDLTDVPVGSGKAIARIEKFYTQLLKLATPLLATDGWVSAQAGAAVVRKPMAAYFDVLLPIFREYLADVEKSIIPIPSFLDDEVFIYAKKKE